MRNTCTICLHPELESIDLALRQGSSRRTVATQFEISESALQRHRQHARKKAAKAARAATTLPTDATASEVEHWKAEAQRIIRDTDDEKIRIAALRELRGYLELEVRLQQEAKGSSSLTSDPAFQRLAAFLADCLCERCRERVEGATDEALASAVARLRDGHCAGTVTSAAAVPATSGRQNSQETS